VTTGAWQTIAANAGVLPNEEIYKLEVYLMGSWSSAPGGSWTGTVVYDSLFADMMSPVDTSQIGGGATVAVVDSGELTSGSAGSHTHEFTTTVTYTMGAASYTNTTGRTIYVSVLASVYEVFMYVSSVLLTRKFYISVSGSVSTDGDYDVHAHAESIYAGNDPGGTRRFTFSVASGSTLTVTLKLHSTTAANEAVAELHGSGRITLEALKV
jgi:hypothetical protein